MSPRLKGHVLIICTHQRREVLHRCLSHLAQCTVLPESIFVIEPKPFSSQSLIEEFAAHLPLTYLPSDRASLPYQRNLGIKASPKDCEIIHFIDDDLLVEPAYFDVLNLCFQHQDCIGAGGLILPILQKKADIHPFSCLFLHDDRQPGKILSSGWTSESQSRDDLNERTNVEWLSGCSMSFKKSVFEHHFFDEQLEGYAQDEDLDFCYRIRALGNLYCDPEAKGTHLNLGKNLRNSDTHFHIRWEGRIRFIRKNMPDLKHRLGMSWALLGIFLVVLRKPKIYTEHLQSLPGLLKSIWA